MKIDASMPPVGLNAIPQIAKAAEEMGFDALWTQETMHDPFLPGALIAEHTQRLQFGTAVAIAFARSPANLAYTAWDLAAASGGRFLLGLGTQVKAHVERRFGQPWPESPVGKLREEIQAIHAFWNTWQNGAPFNFRGDYYKLTLMSPFFNPGSIQNPHIPISIAGVNTGLARLAGELADGFHVHPFHSQRYVCEVILPAIQEGAAKAGRSRADVQVIVTPFVATNPMEKEFARQQIAFYASTPSYHPVMELHGWNDEAAKLSSLASRGQWGDMSAVISDEMLSTFAVLADPADLMSAVLERYQGAADRLSLYMPFVPGERDAFWKEVVRAKDRSES